MDLHLNAWADELGLPGMGNGTSVLNEHEEPIQDVVMPVAELPSISEEVGMAEDSEAAMEDCIALFASIIEAGGMDQTFATEAMRIIPDFCDSAPIGYFTKQPSATKLSVSLESISLKIAALIAAAVAAVGAIIYKILKWAFGSDTDDSPKDIARNIASDQAEERKEEEKVTESLNDLAKEAVVVEKVLQRGVKVKVKTKKDSDQEEEVTVHSVRDIFDVILSENKDAKAEVDNFLNEAHPIFDDFLENGDLTKIVTDINHSLKNFDSEIKDKVAELSKIVHSLYDSNNNGNVDGTNKVKLELNTKIMGHRNGEETPFTKILAEFDTINDRVVHGSSIKVRYNFGDVLTKYCKSRALADFDATSKSYVDVTQSLAMCEAALEEIGKRIGSPIADNQVSGGLSSEEATWLRERRAELVALISDVSKAMRILKQHLEHIRTCSDRLTKFSLHVARIMEGLFRQDGVGSDQMPDAIKSLKKVAKDTAEAVKRRNDVVRKKRKK